MSRLLISVKFLFGCLFVFLIFPARQAEQGRSLDRSCNVPCWIWRPSTWLCVSLFEDSFALARIAQVTGKCRWCLCVGVVSALVEDVVYERRRVVGFITVEVDDVVRCLLCRVCWENLDYFVSSCDRHCINPSSCKLQFRCGQVARVFVAGHQERCVGEEVCIRHTWWYLHAFKDNGSSCFA